MGVERPHGRRKADELLQEQLEYLRGLVRALLAGIVVLLLVLPVLGYLAVENTSDANVASKRAEAAAADADRLAREVADNAATIEDLCEISRRQRRTLRLSFRNSTAYLKNPSGDPALQDLVRRLSLPQLRQRIEREKVPERCRNGPSG